MNKDTEQIDVIGETGEEALEKIAEAAAEIENIVENDVTIERVEVEEVRATVMQIEEASAVLNSVNEIEAETEMSQQEQGKILEATTEADGATKNVATIDIDPGVLDERAENTAATLKSVSEVEAEAETSQEAEEEIVEIAPEAKGPRENESIIEWLERMEGEAKAADEKVKQTAAALKSAREVEGEAKSQAVHTRKRLKIANHLVRKTLDTKYRAECAAEQVTERLQYHKIQAAKNAADQVIREARERARFELEEAKWKAKKAEQETNYRKKWEADTTGEPGENKAPLKSVGEVKAEAKREAEQIRKRLHQTILQAKREAQEAQYRAKREAEAANKEISKDAQERIEKLHFAILGAINNRNEINIEADAADERAIKKTEALKSAMEAYDEAKREAEEARKRLREAMSAAKKETKEARDRANRKAREATMMASGNEISGFVRLQIARPVTHEPIREFELALAQSSSFQVESVGGTADEGAYIDVFIDEPVHLLSILSEMPHTESFWKNDKGIKVELKTADLN